MISVAGLVEPMVSKIENRMQMFNESFVLIFTYHLYPLTDFMPDFGTRNLVGKSLMGVTLANLGANILVSGA